MSKTKKISVRLKNSSKTTIFSFLAYVQYAENFIVLPREINLQKDELKQRQLRACGDRSDKGCWIISWVPKKLEDGTYSRVWPIHSRQDLASQAQMEASAPNPPQL